MYRDNVDAQDREGQRGRSFIGRLLEPIWRVAGRLWFTRSSGTVGASPFFSRVTEEIVKDAETGDAEPKVSPYGARLPQAELADEERREAAEELQRDLKDG